MKKKLFTLLLLLLLLPITIYAETTCPVVTDTTTTDSRNLTCDAKKQTVTSFKTSKEETVLENDVCTIKCTENLIFSFDPIKKVLAGTSFNYPLYVSGERKCTATYKYEDYEKTIAKLVGEYASLTGDAKTTKGNELTNYYDLRKACDEFTKDGSDYEKKYKTNATVTLDVETSTVVDKIKYVYKEISDYNSQVEEDTVRYYACDYDEVTKKCKESMRTLNTWTETARIFGKYTMPNTYIERYTGEVKSTSTSTTCNAGDRYFTNFNELTKPLKDSKNDNGYKLTLVGNNLGNNLISGGSRWDMTVNCFYQVKNLSFPQGGGTSSSSGGGIKDENYDEYGNTAFVYRTIELDDPFPDRDPGANWYGQEKLILSTKDNLDALSKFEIALNRSSIRKVREYNQSYPYDTFNLNEMEKSLFIINNTSIVKRK